jgi:dienelactone hydrolase
MKKIIFFFVFVLLIAGALWAARGLVDFDLGNHEVREVSFTTKDAVLAGTLILPSNVENPPVAITVHGDGPQDRFSSGGYLPIINTLADAGIGVFTWDKAGVGESTGNWLDQTMDDRAVEALAARLAIAELDRVTIDQIGFLGFSQAGWVLPKVANQITPAFTVIVGGAVSWREQGTYYNQVRLAADGVAPQEIAQRLKERIEKDDALFGAPITPTAQTDMEPDRLRFVANAYWEDSTADISGMQGPVLAIWGEQDLNVDADSDAATFKNSSLP